MILEKIIVGVPKPFPIYYNSWLVEIPEVSCTDTARRAGGRRGTGGAGKGGSKGKTSATGGGGKKSSTGGGSPSGKSSSSGQSGARGARSGSGSTSGSGQSAPSAPAAPASVGEASAESSAISSMSSTNFGGTNTSYGWGTDSGGYSNDTSSMVVGSQAKQAEQKMYAAMDAQRQTEQKAVERQTQTSDYSSIYSGTGEPAWVSDLKAKAKPQQQYDPQTGYVGIPRESVPTYLGGTQDTTQTQDVSPRASSQLQQYLAEQTAKETEKVMGTETEGVRTDFWGTTQAQSSVETERQIQILLADVHIRNTSGDIQALQSEIGSLSTIMDNERARIAGEQGESMSSYTEAMLISDSALYKESKFRKERLEGELAEKKRYLDTETAKKEKWESVTLTESADIAFREGISYTDPMTTDLNLGQPIVTGTLKYDDIIPTLPVQKPDKENVFEGLELPSVSALKLDTVDPLSAVLPTASAEEEGTGWAPIKEGQSLEDYQAQVLGTSTVADLTPDQQIAASETYVLDEGDLSKPQKIEADIYQVMLEDAEKVADDKLFLTSYDEETGKPNYGQIVSNKVLMPDGTVRTEGTQTIRTPIPWHAEVRDGKVVKVSDETGKVITKDYKIERVGTVVDPKSAEGQVIQKLYAQQAYNKYLNQLQKERFEAAKSGEISVQSFLAEAGTGEQAATLKWFEERGIPLSTPMGAIDFAKEFEGVKPTDKTSVPLVDTLKEQGVTDKKVLADAEGVMHDVYTPSLNLQGAEGWAKEGKEEQFDTKGVELQNIHTTAKLEYDARFAQKMLDKHPEEDTFMLFPSAAAEEEVVGTEVSRDDVLSTVQAWSASGKFGVGAGMSPTDEPELFYANPAAGDKYEQQMQQWETSYRQAGDAPFTHMYVEEDTEGNLIPTALGIQVLRGQAAIITDTEFEAQQMWAKREATKELFGDLTIETGYLQTESDPNLIAAGLFGEPTLPPIKGIPTFAVGAVAAPNVQVEQMGIIQKFGDQPYAMMYANSENTFTDGGAKLSAGQTVELTNTLTGITRTFTEMPTDATYSEMVDMGIYERVNFVDEYKYLTSRGLRPAVNIAKMSGQFMGKEGHQIYEETLLEKTMGSIIGAVQHGGGTYFGWTDTDPESDTYGMKFGSEEAEGRLGTTMEEGFGEIAHELHLESKQWEDRGYGYVPWGTLAEMPLEAGLMFMPVKIRPVIMAGLKILPKTVAPTAGKILKPKSLDALARQEYGKRIATRPDTDVIAQQKYSKPFKDLTTKQKDVVTKTFEASKPLSKGQLSKDTYGKPIQDLTVKEKKAVEKAYNKQRTADTGIKKFDDLTDKQKEHIRQKHGEQTSLLRAFPFNIPQVAAFESKLTKASGMKEDILQKKMYSVLYPERHFKAGLIIKSKGLLAMEKQYAKLPKQVKEAFEPAGYAMRQFGGRAQLKYLAGMKDASGKPLYSKGVISSIKVEGWDSLDDISLREFKTDYKNLKPSDRNTVDKLYKEQLQFQRRPSLEEFMMTPKEKVAVSKTMLGVPTSGDLPPAHAVFQRTVRPKDVDDWVEGVTDDYGRMYGDLGFGSGTGEKGAPFFVQWRGKSSDVLAKEKYGKNISDLSPEEKNVIKKMYDEQKLLDAPAKPAGDDIYSRGTISGEALDYVRIDPVNKEKMLVVQLSNDEIARLTTAPRGIYETAKGVLRESDIEGRFFPPVKKMKTDVRGKKVLDYWETSGSFDVYKGMRGLEGAYQTTVKQPTVFRFVGGRGYTSGVIPKVPKRGRPSKVYPAVDLFPKVSAKEVFVGTPAGIIKTTRAGGAVPATKGLTELELRLWKIDKESVAQQRYGTAYSKLGTGQKQEVANILRTQPETFFAKAIGERQGLARQGAGGEGYQFKVPTTQRVEDYKDLLKAWGEADTEVARLSTKWQSPTVKESLRRTKAQQERYQLLYEEMTGGRLPQTEVGQTGVAEWVHRVDPMSGKKLHLLRVRTKEFDKVGAEIYLTKEQVGKGRLKWKKSVYAYIGLKDPMKFQSMKDFTITGLSKKQLQEFSEFKTLGIFELEEKAGGLVIKKIKGKTWHEQLAFIQAGTRVMEKPLTPVEQAVTSEYRAVGNDLGKMSDFDQKTFIEQRQVGRESLTDWFEDLSKGSNVYGTPKMIGQDLHTEASAKAANIVLKAQGKLDDKFGRALFEVKKGDVVVGTGRKNPVYESMEAKIKLEPELQAAPLLWARTLMWERNIGGIKELISKPPKLTTTQKEFLEKELLTPQGLDLGTKRKSMQIFSDDEVTALATYFSGEELMPSLKAVASGWFAKAKTWHPKEKGTGAPIPKKFTAQGDAVYKMETQKVVQTRYDPETGEKYFVERDELVETHGFGGFQKQLDKQERAQKDWKSATEEASQHDNFSEIHMKRQMEFMEDPLPAYEIVEFPTKKAAEEFGMWKRILAMQGAIADPNTLAKSSDEIARLIKIGASDIEKTRLDVAKNITEVENLRKVADIKRGIFVDQNVDAFNVIGSTTKEYSKLEELHMSLGKAKTKLQQDEHELSVALGNVDKWKKQEQGLLKTLTFGRIDADGNIVKTGEITVPPREYRGTYDVYPPDNPLAGFHKGTKEKPEFTATMDEMVDEYGQPVMSRQVKYYDESIRGQPINLPKIEAIWDGMGGNTGKFKNFAELDARAAEVDAEINRIASRRYTETDDALYGSEADFTIAQNTKLSRLKSEQEVLRKWREENIETVMDTTTPRSQLVNNPEYANYQQALRFKHEEQQTVKITKKKVNRGKVEIAKQQSEYDKMFQDLADKDVGLIQQEYFDKLGQQAETFTSKRFKASGFGIEKESDILKRKLDRKVQGILADYKMGYTTLVKVKDTGKWKFVTEDIAKSEYGVTIPKDLVETAKYQVLPKGHDFGFKFKKIPTYKMRQIQAVGSFAAPPEIRTGAYQTVGFYGTTPIGANLLMTGAKRVVAQRTERVFGKMQGAPVDLMPWGNVVSPVKATDAVAVLADAKPAFAQLLFAPDKTGFRTGIEAGKKYVEKGVLDVEGVRITPLTSQAENTKLGFELQKIQLSAEGKLRNVRALMAETVDDIAKIESKEWLVKSTRTRLTTLELDLSEAMTRKKISETGIEQTVPDYKKAALLREKIKEVKDEAAKQGLEDAWMFGTKYEDSGKLIAVGRGKLEKMELLEKLQGEEMTLRTGIEWTGDYVRNTLGLKKFVEPWEFAKRTSQELGFKIARGKQLKTKLERLQQHQATHVRTAAEIRSQQAAYGQGLLQTKYGGDMSRSLGQLIKIPAQELLTNPTGWRSFIMGQRARMPEIGSGTYGGVRQQIFSLGRANVPTFPEEKFGFMQRLLRVSAGDEYMGKGIFGKEGGGTNAFHKSVQEITRKHTLTTDELEFAVKTLHEQKVKLDPFGKLAVGLKKMKNPYFSQRSGEAGITTYHVEAVEKLLFKKYGAVVSLGDYSKDIMEMLRGTGKWLNKSEVIRGSKGWNNDSMRTWWDTLTTKTLRQKIVQHQTVQNLGEKTRYAKTQMKYLRDRVIGSPEKYAEDELKIWLDEDGFVKNYQGYATPAQLYTSMKEQLRSLKTSKINLGRRQDVIAEQRGKEVAPVTRKKMQEAIDFEQKNVDHFTKSYESSLKAFEFGRFGGNIGRVTSDWDEMMLKLVREERDLLGTNRLEVLTKQDAWKDLNKDPYHLLGGDKGKPKPPDEATPQPDKYSHPASLKLKTETAAKDAGQVVEEAKDSLPDYIDYLTSEVATSTPKAFSSSPFYQAIRFTPSTFGKGLPNLYALPQPLTGAYAETELKTTTAIPDLFDPTMKPPPTPAKIVQDPVEIITSVETQVGDMQSYGLGLPVVGVPDLRYGTTPAVITTPVQDVITRTTPVVSPRFVPLVTQQVPVITEAPFAPFVPIPPPTIPPLLGLLPDSQPKRRRRRRAPKRKKRKIWWDVPSQPLGEPWSPREYVVFGTAGTKGEPRKVKKKEKKKGLDSIVNFDFLD